MDAALSFLAKEFLGAEHRMCEGFPVCPWVLWKIPGFAENSDFLLFISCVWQCDLVSWNFAPKTVFLTSGAPAKFKRRVLLVGVLKGIFSMESWSVGHKAL